MSLFELADYVAFAVIALVGAEVGRRMRPRPPEPLRPMCSCGHGFGTHENSQRCHGETERVRYNSNGDQTGYIFVPCACLRYDGPDPAIFGLEAPR